MGARSERTQAGAAGFAAVGLGAPAHQGWSAATWTHVFFLVALLFVLAVHFRVGFSASAAG